MADSVYAAILKQRIDTEASYLFLQRSNGEWWLPGGKILPEHRSPTDAIRYWVNNLVTLYDWHPGGIGLWHLSPEAGGHKVRLFESYTEKSERIRIKDPTSGLTQSLAWFYRDDIERHLYVHRDMPWGQAKMALYAFHDLYKGERRANGDLLRDDLGEAGGKKWNRPT